MPAGVSFYKALRYLFPENFVVTTDIVYVDEYSPDQVRYEPGAIGFEFIRIVEVESPDGEISRHALNRKQYFYWGQRISLYDLEDSPIYEKANDYRVEHFCLTNNGGLIPLDEEEQVVPYPDAIELPADMRLE
jgi:hypothetical protein